MYINTNPDSAAMVLSLAALKTSIKEYIYGLGKRHLSPMYCYIIYKQKNGVADEVVKGRPLP